MHHRKTLTLAGILILIGTNANISAQEMVKDLNPNDKGSGIGVSSSTDNPVLFSLNNSLYFWAVGNRTTEIPGGLYKTDGTGNGTSYVGNSPEKHSVVYNNKIYILVANGLYSAGGGTEKESGKDNNAGKVAGNVLKNMVTVNGQPLGTNSSGNDAGKNNQLPGFDQVKSKDEMLETWYNTSLIPLNGSLYFFGTDKDKDWGCKLWKSDGTKQGTMPVLGIPCRPWSFQNYSVVNGVLFFVADDNTNGNEIWRTDGTAAGTFMLKDINNKYFANGNTAGSTPAEFIQVGNLLYFIASNANGIKELWKSDGTKEGTTIVSNPGYDLGIGHCSNFHRGLAASGNTLYFSANTTVKDKTGQKIICGSLWKTDGSEKGTQMIISYPQSGYAPMWLTMLDSTLFFIINDGVYGQELWKSNGTKAGTKMVKDINQQGGSGGKKTEDAFQSVWDCRPDGEARPALTVAEGQLYFVANDGVHGNELWKSDGTDAGTSMVVDIKSFGGFGSNPKDLICINHVLYFTADDGPHGRELWKYPLLK